jgi:hypothetical protein
MVLTATNLGLKLACYTPGQAFNLKADVIWGPIKVVECEDFQIWVKQQVNAGRVWWIETKSTSFSPTLTTGPSSDTSSHLRALVLTSSVCLAQLLLPSNQSMEHRPPGKW